MKKTYVKPALAVESFVLSQSIAAGCGAAGSGWELGRPNQSSINACGWKVDGIIVWLDSTSVCTDIQLNPGTEYEGVCYHTPESGLNIFGS